MIAEYKSAGNISPITFYSLNTKPHLFVHGTYQILYVTLSCSIHILACMYVYHPV